MGTSIGGEVQVRGGRGGDTGKRGRERRRKVQGYNIPHKVRFSVLPRTPGQYQGCSSLSGLNSGYSPYLQ